MSLSDTLSLGATDLAFPSHSFERVALGEWTSATATFEQLNRLYVDNTLTKDGVNSYVIKRLKHVARIGSSLDDQPFQAHLVLRVPQNCGITEAMVFTLMGEVVCATATPGNLTKILRGGR